MADYKYGTYLPTDYDKIDNPDNLDIAGYPKDTVSSSDSVYTKLLNKLKPTTGLDLSETNPYGFAKTPTVKDLASVERPNVFQNTSIPRRYSDLMPSQIQYTRAQTPTIKNLPSTTTLPEAAPLGQATTRTTTSATTQPAMQAMKSPGLFDWFKNLTKQDKRALSVGLLSTGLGLMSAAGRTSNTPISTFGLFGDAGQQGLNTYMATKDMDETRALRNAYLGLAEKQGEREQGRLGLEQEKVDVEQRKYAAEDVSKEAKYMEEKRDKEYKNWTDREAVMIKKLLPGERGDALSLTIASARQDKNSEELRSSISIIEDELAKPGREQDKKDWYELQRRINNELKLGASALPNAQGYEREPTESEDTFFKDNPHVAGMATEDDKVIINKYSDRTPREKEAVKRLEISRIFMKQDNIVPDFELTDKQKEFFEKAAKVQKGGLLYKDNPVAAKQSLVSRIIVGDPSAQDVTPEQKAFAEKVKKQMDAKFQTTGGLGLSQPTQKEYLQYLK